MPEFLSKNLILMIMSLNWQFFNCSLTEPWILAEWGEGIYSFQPQLLCNYSDNGWMYEPFSISCLGRQMWRAITKVQGCLGFFGIGMLLGIPWHRYKHLSAERRGLTTAMGPRCAKKGPSSWSNFRAQQSQNSLSWNWPTWIIKSHF